MSLSMREDQCKKEKAEGNVDGSYHEKVDLVVFGEVSQEKRRKYNPMGLKQEDFNKLGKLTHNILCKSAKKKKDFERLSSSPKKQC